MNLRLPLAALSFSVLAGLASCDKDSKVFSDADLSTERSSVAGRVTGRGDSGLVGVVVTATAVDAKGAALADVPSQTALSGSDGRWSLELRPGLRWRFAWSSPDYKTPDEGVSIDLGLRESRILDEERLTYRYGEVAGRTLPGASVAIEGQDVSATADANGDFKLERVAPGAVEIVGVVRGKGFWRTVDSVASESTTSVATRTQIATWKPLSSVSGTLVNQDGSPQAGAVLSALGGLVRDTTDAQGRFAFDALPANGRAVIDVSRSTGTSDRVVLSTPPEDSSWDLGDLPVTGSVTSNGVAVSDGLVVADSGAVVALPLLWRLLDTTRTVIGFAWDTSGTGSTARAIRTWGPRLAGVRVGGTDRSISVWVCVAAPLSGGGFDTLWTSERTIRLMVRRQQAAPDTLPAPRFSHDSGEAVPAPLKVGLSSDVDGAAIFWSTDSASSASWQRWTGDSIELYATSTVWAYSRMTRRLDSRIVRRTFDVIPATKPETLQAKLAATRTTLVSGATYVPTACPDLSAGGTLVLDSGSTLTLPENCELVVENSATLELRAGATLAMRRGSSVFVGSGTSGKLVVKGRVGRRARIRSTDSANPAGYSTNYLVALRADAGGSVIQGLELDGSTGAGIQIQDVAVDVIDSRIRNCAGAGIAYLGTGHPATDSGIRNDSISRSRWSLDISPAALGRVATNPGFADTIRVYDGTAIGSSADPDLGNVTWRSQPVPLRIDNEVVVDNQSTLVLEPGLELRMGATGSFWVDAGVFEANGTHDAPVRFLRANRSLAWGYGSGNTGYGIKVTSNGTVSLRWTEIAGTDGSGLVIQGTADLHDVRSDSNAYAGILYESSGRPTTDTSFARVRAKGNRWSLVTSPLALGFTSTCPGLADSILLADGGNLVDNGAWRTQSAPIVVDGFEITIGSGANLAIDSGTTYVMGQGTSFYVTDGSLTVSGTAGSPVRFLPRTATGWGYNPGNAGGYAIKFTADATGASFSHMVLRGAQSNGILFAGTLTGVGSIDSSAVVQTATPTAGTFGVVLERAFPKFSAYVGTCDDGGSGGCP